MLSGKSTVGVSEPVGNARWLSQTDYVDIAAFVLQSNGRRVGEERLIVNAISNGTAALDRAR
jgi:hypothetical protein